MFGKNRERGMRIVGWLFAISAIAGMFALYFPVLWR